ncbi:MAG: LEPR-XLL domain-containing protein, partial [Opitutaceae bacterium]|nr:LEPR-XLL domain-containing protein [Opitutaceae bacterium]
MCSFAVEALESRLLLSATPVAPGVIDIAATDLAQVALLATTGHAGSVLDAAEVAPATGGGLFQDVALSTLNPETQSAPAPAEPAAVPVSIQQKTTAEVVVPTVSLPAPVGAATVSAPISIPTPPSPTAAKPMVARLVETLNASLPPPATAATSAASLPSLTQTSTDTLTISIGGADTGSYTQIVVTGTATLAGTLAVTFTNDFKPEVGEVFDILTFGSVTGKFDHATGIFGFGDGKVYLEIVQQADRIQLVARSFTFGTDNFVFNLAGPTAQNLLGEFFSFSYFGLTTATVSGALDLGGFVQLAGSFTLTRLNNLSASVGGAAKLVSGFTLAAANVRVFVGANGPYWLDSNNDGTIDGSDTPSTTAIGFAASGVDVALLWAKPNDTADTTSYYGLKASATTASLVGMGSALTFALKGLTVEINRATASDGTTATPIDFSVLSGGGYGIVVGGGTLLLDYSATTKRAGVQEATISIGNFISFVGSLVLDSQGFGDQTLSDGSTKNVSQLTIGMAGVRAFVGLGVYWVDSNTDGTIDGSDTPDANAIGLAASGVDLALALFTPSDIADVARYYAFALSGATASLVGVDQVTMSITGFTAAANDVTGVAAGSPVIDFSKIDGGGLSVATGGSSIFLDYNSRALRAAASDATLVISSFIYVRGGFGFDFSPNISETLDGGGTRALDAIVIGASNAYVFAGVGGPYW